MQLNHFHLQGVGIAGLAIDGAAGEDHVVTGIQIELPSFLYCNCCYVLYSLAVAHSSTDVSIEKHVSYGTHCFHHLASYGACLPAGQVTVVAVGQVDADLACCLHLELVHCLPCLGDVQLIVIVAHNRSFLFGFPESEIDFPDWRVIFFP